MNVKIKALTAGVLFFIGGQVVMAQKVKRDTADTKNIDEVVVVAYGKQKKEAIVGSVSTVDSKTLATQQATSVLSALQGTVAGVNLISSSGQPGDNPSIYIRGISSINASTQPLIVLDGSPFNGNISMISQDQIESMSVLKDASATTLYGSRGANGVIIITTKQGKRNSKPKVTITSLAGVSTPAVKLYKTLDAENFMKYTWQAIKNNQVYTNKLSESAASQYATDNLISGVGYNPYNVKNPIDTNGNVVAGAKLLWDTDWERELVNQAAFKQEHRLSVSGGSDNTTYFLGADYLDMDGNVKTSNFERIGFRANIDSKVNNWLEVGFNTAFSTSYSTYPTQSGTSYQSAIQWIYTIPNIYPLYQRDENGGMILDQFGNPIYDYGVNANQLVNGTRPTLSNENGVGALHYYDYIRRKNYYVANGFAQINLTKDLTLRSQGSFENQLTDNYDYISNQYGYAASVGGRVSQERILSKTINWFNSLSYDKSFGKHNVYAQGLFEIMDYKYDYLSAQGTGFLPGVKVLNGATKPESVGGYFSPERLVSYMGRFSYNYNQKYYLEGSYRRDGSSRFSADTRWGDFWSVGGSWVVSKEKFFTNNVMNYLKIKSSYGELGNNKTLDENGNPAYFPYIQGFEVGWNNLDQTGVVLTSAVDPFLKWETTSSLNVGAEMGFFNNRITANFDYFQKKSVDLIYDKPLPGSTGNQPSSIVTNIGAIKNTGWELDITSRNFKGSDFEWTTNLNLYKFKNKITELTQESFINGTKRWAVGTSLYDFYLAEWAGVDSQTGMGTWYYNVTNTDGTVSRQVTSDYSLANATTSRIYKGSSLPDITGGFGNYFRYKSFDLNVLFNFSYGAYMYDSQYASLMSGFSSAGRQQSVDIMNAWQKPGDITDTPINIMVQNNNNAQSTRFLFKNDYVRLKSLTLGYNVKNSLTRNFGVSQFRIFLQGDNLWTWQSHKGIDPEQSIAGTTNYRSYNLRTMSLGVTIGF